MADNVADYQTLLADMEAKKAVLEQAIASLRAAIALGTLGPSGDLPPGSGPIAPMPGTGSSGDIPKGAFFRKTLPESITLYLAAVRKRCPTNEIIQGLKKGGIVSTSKTFDIVVGNTLRRLKSDGKLLPFDDGWGLPEWVPEGLRSRMEQQNKVQPKKRGAKKKTTKAKTKVMASEKPANSTKDSEASRPKTLIENYFSTHPGAVLSAKEIAGKLDISGHGLALVLTQMARKGGIETTADGKFRRSNKVTPISKAG